jgi:pentatricopeptide repeat protein
MAEPAAQDEWRGLNLGVIGNCTFSAVIDDRGRHVWCCLPRFDGDPVFSALVNREHAQDTGFWDVELSHFARSEQRYLPNTAILETTLWDDHGGSIRITDFAPRFKQYGRTFRPHMLARQIAPLSGTPQITIRLRPAFNYAQAAPTITRGSNHIRYRSPEETFRLTTDCAVTFIEKEQPFILEDAVTMFFGADESLEESVSGTYRNFLERTQYYWTEWCRYLAVPFEWQNVVIRSAITLKLSSFEETGAIIAAATTSIPESDQSRRNWDYRFCWLRDSYFVVRALNHLGVTRTMQGYLTYIKNIIVGSEDGYLQPVFGILHEKVLTERVIDGLSGYDGAGTVRVGNDAYRQVQNDGYGSVILASAQSFFDQRLDRPGDIALFESLERFGKQALARWDKPDAGLWEYRTRAQVHTFSSVMCWAACDRLSKIAVHLDLPDRARVWADHATWIRDGIMARAWNAELQAFTNSFGGDDADASLLMLPQLGFVDGKSAEFLGTLAFIEKNLKHGNYLFRYRLEDDFGVPETSFNVCTFWYIDGLASAGRIAEARELFEHMLERCNHLGLLSEDIDPETGELWGNFPQTYSMVGLIYSAIRLSKSWEDAF